MKALLIHPLNIDDESLVGLRKKMNSQFSSFSNFVESDLVCFGNKGIYFNDKILCKFKAYPKGLNFINFYINFYSMILKEVDISSYDFIYIRYPLSNPFFISFLKEVKRLIKNENIFIEIPTFPYDKEAINLKRKLILFTDHLYRNKLKKYVKKIITHYGQKQIYGVDCFYMGNGVDFNELGKKKSYSLTDIRLLGIGNLSFYHGYDRLINGLKNYYINKNVNDPKVYLDIAGMGLEYNNLIQLLRKNKLEKYVFFHGVKLGQELQDLIDNADIGIGTLGMHRKNMDLDNSLKSREYCLQGLPFISCTYDLDFPDDFPFRRIVGLNDKSIDVLDLLNYFKDMKSQFPNYRSEINSFANDNLLWDVKVKKFLQLNMEYKHSNN